MGNRGRLIAPGGLRDELAEMAEDEPAAGESLAEMAAQYGLIPSSARPGLVSYLARVWQRRHFIFAYATARNVSMYTEARLGQLWQVLTPLLNSAVYYLIFGILFKANRGISNYTAYLVTGVFIFAFTERSIVVGSTVMRANMTLIRALHFPRACLPLAYVLVEDEHMVMAEALFTFLVMVSMLLVIWRTWVPWPVALLAGLLAGYAVNVRSEGLPVLLMFPVVLLVRGLRRDGAWRWRNWRAWLAAVAMAVGCAAPAAAYAGWFHSWWGSYTLSRAEGFYLWGRVSSFAECPVIKPPASEQAICPSGTPSSRTPPGDYIWHAPQVHHMANGGPVTAANDALLRDFAIRAVKAQPLGYLHAVLGGLALAVEWPRHPYPDPGTVYFYYFHRTPYPIPAAHSWVAGGTAYSDAVQYGHATPSRVVRPVAILIDGYQRVFYTYGPLFGLILLTGLGGVLRLRLRRGRLPRLSWSPRSGSMLPWATAVVLLVFPIAVADFDYRYLLPVLPFACLAAGLAFAPARVPPAPEAAPGLEPDPLAAQAPGAA